MSIKLIPASALGDLPPTEILGDTHFIARGFNVVFGASGAFKSFYTLNAALSVAQSSPVVYVAAEGAGGLHRRVAAWCSHYDLTPGQLYFVCQEVNLLNEAQIKSLITATTELKPALTVFDTLARCIPGGDENSAKDMGVAVQHSALLQRALDCAVTWVHHTNRAERGERGSGAMRGAADSMIELTAGGDNLIRVGCSKVKDSEAWPTEELRFHSVGDSGVLLPNDGSSTKLSTQDFQILDFLSLEVFETCGASIRQMVAALNASERTLYRTLSRMKRDGYIQQDKRGDPYSLADAGIQALQRNQRLNNLNLITPDFTVNTTN